VSDDLTRLVAFAYHRRGVDVMERSKLPHLLTFDLRWFSPDPAKRILARAVESGLLAPEGDGMLRVTFEPRSIEVPLNWRPNEKLADEQGPLTVPAPGPRPTPAPDAAEAERARLGNLISVDVARLILARRAGEDVREHAAALEQRLVSEASTR